MEQKNGFKQNCGLQKDGGGGAAGSVDGVMSGDGGVDAVAMGVAALGALGAARDQVGELQLQRLSRLRVLRWYLQREGHTVRVEVVIQGYQRPMHTRFH